MHDGFVPWSAVFGNDRPVEVEIGPGRGEPLLAAAAAAPSRNFFGIERKRGAAGALEARAAGRGLTNLVVVAADARCLIGLVGDASVAAYHVYFPDPWPKTRHRSRRLVTAAFAAALHRTLAPGAKLHLATDLPAVFDAACMALEACGFERIPGATPPAERPVSKYERRYAPGGGLYALFRRPT